LGIVLAIISLAIYSLICLIFLSRSYVPPTFDAKYEKLPMASIVIPTFNEETIVVEKLNDLMALDYPSDKLELVVVDSSTDRTPNLVGAYDGKFPVRLIRENVRKGEASALNVGYSSAKGEIIVKSDCDSTSDDVQALRKLVSNFSDPQIGGVSCLYTSSYSSRTESGYRGILRGLQSGESAVDSTVIAHGPFVGFRKSVLQPVSPDSAADDTELFVKIRRRGHRCVVDGRVVFREIRPDSMSMVLSQRSRRAHGILRVLFSNVDILFNPSYGKYGILVFPSNLFMLAVSPTLLLAAALLLGFGLILQYALWGALIVALLVLSTGFIIRTERPRAIAGFLRAQEAAFLGLVLFLSREPKHVWQKAR
jgi:cellulose synthase/poly-beta-1,6-N-acetylglucosamine synthase-like glycosyltransferase